jgi:hypothetical protein
MMPNANRIKRFLQRVSLLLAVLFSAGVLAQDAPADDGVVYKKKTVYNFEDDTITGDLTRPDQEFLSGRVMAQHKSLIKIREDFKERVLQSVGDL